MKTDIWMPLYIGDYLSATSRLTTEQHGAYFLILMDYWKNGPPPNDDKVLAQITRMPFDAWCNASSTIKSYFKHVDGMLIHARVETELKKSIERKESAVIKAKAGAAAKWAKHASSSPQAMLDPMLGDASSPSPSPSSLSTSTPTSKKHSAAFAACPSGVSENLWSDFVILRRAKKLPLTQTAINGLIREGEKAGLSISAVVQTCCERGWGAFKASWLHSEAQGKGNLSTPQLAAARAIFGDERKGDTFEQLT